MTVEIELINHYPWLPSTKIVYSDISRDNPVDFIKRFFMNSPIDELRKRIFNIFDAAFENKEEILNYKIDELNVFLYLMINILLTVLDDNAIANKVANLYSKANKTELKNENDYVLYKICEDLNLNIRYYEEPITFRIKIIKNQREEIKTNFTLAFTNYLNLASNMRDDYRRLINNSLENGYVYIQKEDLIRLIQEHVRKKLIPRLHSDKSTLKILREKLLGISEFKEIYDKILEKWELMKPDYEPLEFQWGENIDLTEIAPPCLKHVLQKASESQNLIHNERLFLVFLLHALKIPIENIVKIFSNLPDFDRDKTLYQVNFALNKKYTPHKCATLKSLNICMAEKFMDELCLKGYYSKAKEEKREINHPMTYIYLKQYSLSKRKDKMMEKGNE